MQRSREDKRLKLIVFLFYLNMYFGMYPFMETGDTEGHGYSVSYGCSFKEGVFGAIVLGAKIDQSKLRIDFNNYHDRALFDKQLSKYKKCRELFLHYCGTFILEELIVRFGNSDTKCIDFDLHMYVKNILQNIQSDHGDDEIKKRFFTHILENNSSSKSAGKITGRIGIYLGGGSNFNALFSDLCKGCKEVILGQGIIITDQEKYPFSLHEEHLDLDQCMVIKSGLLILKEFEDSQIKKVLYNSIEKYRDISCTSEYARAYLRQFPNEIGAFLIINLEKIQRECSSFFVNYDLV